MTTSTLLFLYVVIFFLNTVRSDTTVWHCQLTGNRRDNINNIMPECCLDIYVNDIANCLTHSILIYIADDTAVFLSSQYINDLYKNMNSDLDDLTNWFKANRLALNVNKSNCMLFKPNCNHNILGNTLNIGVDPIEHKLNCKSMGIFIDNQLRWNNHLSHISAKLSRSVYI